MSNRNAQRSFSWIRKLPGFLKGLFANKPTDHNEAPAIRQKSTEPRAPKIGIALSSGGSKGLCHIGVLEVLEENDIPIQAVSGSSMGAYIAALYASGCSIDQIKELAFEIGTGKNFAKLADPANPLKGFIHGVKARTHLEKTIQRRTFAHFPKELYVVAADLDTYESVVFREGIVSEAVHASCAIPGIVVPPTYHGRRLTDGGVVEPVPVQPLLEHAGVDHVIAVSTVRRLEDLNHPIRAREFVKKEAEMQQRNHSKVKAILSKVSQNINPGAAGNVVDTLRRSIRSAQIRLAEQACRKATISLHPGVESPSQWHDYHRFEEYIEYGRQVATDALPELKKLTEPIVNDNRQEVSMVGGRIA